MPWKVLKKMGLKMFRSKKKPEPAPPTVKQPAKALPRKEEGCSVFNCITGDYKEVGGKPFTFGSQSGSDAMLGGAALEGVEITLTWQLGQCQLLVKEGKPDVVINGKHLPEGTFFGGPGDESTVQIGGTYFFLVKQGTQEEMRRWRAGVSEGQWFLYHWASSSDFMAYESSLHSGQLLENWRESKGPLPFKEILQLVHSRALSLGRALIHLEGSNAAFHAEQLRGFSQIKKAAQIEGKLRCPRCWRRFDVEHMLAIHPTEVGDDKLGELEHLRFLPDRFGADGRALDHAGRACSDWACPHCRGKLPQGFHESPLHILSLVGDSMAGKSYYLTIAIRQLKRILFKNFGVNFSDADAPLNAVLNEMIRTLFNAESASTATLKKTQLVGETYKQLVREGLDVMLPQPFVYRALREDVGAVNVVLYDNAGEHFRPDVNETDKAVATEHLAWSSAILFLFDPVQHIDMRKVIGNCSDPQMDLARTACDQDVLLSEIGGRIHQWKGLRNDEKVRIPVAVIVGKHDLWETALPKTALRTDLIENKRLSLQAIDENSRKVRNLMMEHCADIVSAAEMISTNVTYFPVSAFGSPAVRSQGDRSQNQIGPDPEKLAPFLVEAPILWALSLIEPRLLQSL